jgi:uncharacterized Fe-S center protein
MSDTLRLPRGLTQEDEAWPIYFLDTRHVDLDSPEGVDLAGQGIRRLLSAAMPGPLKGQALVKVHVGEPKCITRMRPDLTAPAAEFLREAGISGVVAGDSTVAYTGPRGHKENPAGHEEAYLELAARHGWQTQGPAGMDFVVLDRPGTSRAGVFSFEREQLVRQVEGVQRFKDFFLAGGFAAADVIVNCAHLTLHGLAGVAACAKSLAMGCSALRGKLRMHQSLLPNFDAERCKACGICVKNCPQAALTLADDAPTPQVDPEACIGCGECEAVCLQRAVTLKGAEITDWKRGEDTLAGRMADYTLGLMQGRWERCVNLLHMYTITPRCDCVDQKQKPMLANSLGFMASRNPFALDRMAGMMLTEALKANGVEAEWHLLGSAEATASYLRQTYGVIDSPPLVTLPD